MNARHRRPGNTQAYSHICEKLRAAFHNLTHPEENTLSMAGSSTGGSLIDDAKLKQLYATMLQCRLLTEYARSLRRQRRALYSASLGQEAIATGCAIDLRPQDTIGLAPQDSIAGLVKGVPLGDLVAQLHARGGKRGIAEYNILSPSSDPAEQLQLANDVAFANKQKHNTNVVVAFTGIAATTTSSARGGWQDALKFAARRSLPIIFVVENNPWVGSNARNGRVVHTLNAQREGLTGITVDGNDVVAVYRVAYESLERVRQGGGPVLIEGKTYRPDGQSPLSTERDPLIHMERYLRARKLFTTQWKNQLVRRFRRDLDAAVEAVNQAANQELGGRPTRYLRASQPVAND
jgi:TPP-dependent pyruvate/acetoin dehydrogenase alpha subunit